MMRFLAFTFALGIASITTAAEEFKLEAGYTMLFDGKDLTGWKVAPTKDKDKTGESLKGKTESPNKRFQVLEGAIVIDAKAKGDISITTEKTFAKDVNIKFDFKPSKGCNNDLYLRGIKFDIKVPGIMEAKENEWNTFEINLKGDQAEFICNGMSIKKQKAKPEATPFSIRAEAGAISIRNLRVKE